jgi:hypothetical protein
MVGGSTLNGRKTFIALAAAAMAAVLGAGSAQANQIPGVLISGHITSITGSEWIKIDGKNYRIKSGSPAAAAVGKLTPGQMVDIQLNGPANTSMSEVINVLTHSGP